jgi:uncharacterized protein YbjT (DUF2867 family)
MILVTGASGTNGSAVLRTLAARGVKARALVRTPSKAKDLEAAGVPLVQGDLSDRASLDRAMNGATAVFALAPVHPDADHWFDNLFAAAQAAGVRHVVKYSGLGASPAASNEIMRQHGRSDDRLIASGLSYTILRPNSFYQNLLWHAESIKSQGRFFLPMGDARQSCLDVRDIAEVAALALTDPAHAGRVYDLTGPGALAFPDVAATLSNVLGRPVAYVPVPVEAAVQGMLAGEMPAWNAREVGELLKAFQEPQYAAVNDTLPRLLGRPARTFEAFATDHRAAFLS